MGNKVYIFLLLILAPLFSPKVECTTAYAEFSSTTSQIPIKGGRNLIILENTDAAKNIDIAPTRDKIIIKEDGVYLFIFSAQIGAINKDSTGYIDVWLEKNGKQIHDSNTRSTIDQFDSVGVLVSQAVEFCKAGDEISSTFSASGPSLGLLFIQPENEPSCISFAFTILKIDDLPSKETNEQPKKNEK